MKKNFLFFIFSILTGTSAFSQIDCSGGRYHDSIFSDTVIQNVLFGQNYNYDGTTRQLSMDIYFPKGDTAMMRPLIIFAPKGSFLQENKAELTMVTLCRHFAQMGYVAAAVDYRVGVDYLTAYQYPEREFTYAVMRAFHDYKAAIRFFRQDAATINSYKINPDLIIAGGSSAGAITALHVAYLDKISEIPTSLIDTTGLGGLEGNSGNQGYSSEVNYVVNLCGAIADTVWMEPGDIPVVSMHGNLDTEVPYGTATISMIVPIMEVDGSASINIRAQHAGIDNPFYTFWGKTHIPYDENAGGSYLLYMDTVLTYTTDILYSWICGGGTFTNDIPETDTELNIFPNPSSVLISISSNSGFNDATFFLYDATGRIAVKMDHINGKLFHVSPDSLNKGIYLYRMLTGDNGQYTGKILIH
ncbi:MAG: T9SS type A sorting domain-containing protein [Bacteroidota bacterium]